MYKPLCASRYAYRRANIVPDTNNSLLILKMTIINMVHRHLGIWVTNKGLHRTQTCLKKNVSKAQPSNTHMSQVQLLYEYRNRNLKRTTNISLLSEPWQKNQGIITCSLKKLLFLTTLRFFDLNRMGTDHSGYRSSKQLISIDK